MDAFGATHRRQRLESPHTLCPCTQVSGVYWPPDPGGGSSCASTVRNGIEAKTAAMPWARTAP